MIQWTHTRPSLEYNFRSSRHICKTLRLQQRSWSNIKNPDFTTFLFPYCWNMESCNFSPRLSSAIKEPVLMQPQWWYSFKCLSWPLPTFSMSITQLIHGSSTDVSFMQTFSLLYCVRCTRRYDTWPFPIWQEGDLLTALSLFDKDVQDVFFKG